MNLLPSFGLNLFIEVVSGFEPPHTVGTGKVSFLRQSKTAIDRDPSYQVKTSNHGAGGVARTYSPHHNLHEANAYQPVCGHRNRQAPD